MHDPDNGQLRWVRQLLPDGQVLLLLSALLVVGCSGSAEHISGSPTSTPTPASAARLSTVSVTPSGTNSAPPAITGPSFPKPAGIQPASAPLTELLSFGRPAVEMNGPNGIAVDAQQNVYIGEDMGSYPRLLVFDTSGQLVRTWGGGSGAGDGQFNYITGVALDQAGNVYITDFQNVRVQKFDSQGHFLLAFPTEPPVGPVSLAVDRQGNIYVSNHRRHEHTVQKFDGAGRLLRAWGPPGKGDGQFTAAGTGGPDQLAFDVQGNVYVTDPDNGRVQKFDSEGNFLAAFGAPGREMGQFSQRPYGLSVDREGNIYAAELDGTIQKLDATGKPLARWAGTGASRVIAVDDAGDLYVKDNAANAVHKYRQP